MKEEYTWLLTPEKMAVINGRIEERTIEDGFLPNAVYKNSLSSIKDYRDVAYIPNIEYKREESTTEPKDTKVDVDNYDTSKFKSDDIFTWLDPFDIDDEYIPKEMIGMKDNDRVSVKSQQPYVDMINMIAKEEGVNPKLVASKIFTESRFNQNAISEAGAIGLMQLMPSTAKKLGVDPNNAEENIRGGVKYMKQLLDRYYGDAISAMAAYNAGPAVIDSYMQGTYMEGKNPNSRVTPHGVPNFKETQLHLLRMNKALNHLRF